jgi:hypothetical protein
MEAVMTDIEYTKEDLKLLARISDPGSCIPVELEDMDYDPDKFKEYVRQLPKMFHFLYEVPLGEAFLQVSNPSIRRLFVWRTSISK